MSAKKTAFYGMFLALALVAGYIEQLIPINLGIPGVKLGLANIVTMLLLYIVGVPAACLISVLRILLSGFLFGSGFAMVYSAAGAAMSMLVMALLKKTKKFSSVGVSVAGGIFHNVGQIIVAMIGISLLSPNFNPFWTRSRNLNRNLKRDINKEIKSDNQAAFCINRRKL